MQHLLTYISKILISQEAVDYIHVAKRMKRPNLVIYRDIQTMGCCSSKVFGFIPRVGAFDWKEPDELFAIADNVHGIPVWVERALLPQVNGTYSCVLISGKRIDERAEAKDRKKSKRFGHAATRFEAVGYPLLKSLRAFFTMAATAKTIIPTCIARESNSGVGRANLGHLKWNCW